MSTRKTPPATAAEPPAEPAPIAEGVTGTETVVADQAEPAPIAEGVTDTETVVADQAEPAPIAEGVTDTETVATDQADRAPLAVLIVTPHADGYRRAGRAWTIEPTRVARDALSEEQIKALQDDPLIDLQVVDAA